LYLILIIFSYYSALFSVDSATGASTISATSAGASTTSSATGASSPFMMISLFSILAPATSLVLAALPTLSLK